MASNTPTVVRRFTRDAYDRYELLKEKLLRAGHAEIDILLRLDRIVRQAADPDASERAFDFFGWVLVCEVTLISAERMLVRIVTLEEADPATP